MKIKIKEARENFKTLHGYKISQERLAELVMWDKKSSIKTKLNTLNKMQRGEMSHPSITIISRICTVCGITFDSILDRE
jgi:transcriptional regulator with XRE-family HTH domain